MDLARPTDAAPRFYPVNFHPEFGYFCPRPSFRQRARSACKAAAFGLIAGAIAMFALVPRNQTAEVAWVRPSVASPAVQRAAPVPAADAAYGNPCRTNPWPYPGTGCLAQAPAAWEPVPAAVRTAAVEPAAEAASPMAEQASAAPAPVKKAQKTVKRPRPKEAPRREADPRSAYAGHFSNQRPSANAPNNGWIGFGGGWR